MYSRLLRNASFLKNLRQLRNSHYDHHLSPLEVDLVNKNTMDFLPKPKGSWKEMNDKRQQTNNMTLVIGALIFLSGLAGTYNAIWSDVLFSAPKNKISNDFPGAKFTDA